MRQKEKGRKGGRRKRERREKENSFVLSLLRFPGLNTFAQDSRSWVPISLPVLSAMIIFLFQSLGFLLFPTCSKASVCPSSSQALSTSPSWDYTESFSELVMEADNKICGVSDVIATLLEIRSCTVPVDFNHMTYTWTFEVLFVFLKTCPKYQHHTEVFDEMTQYTFTSKKKSWVQKIYK